MARNSTPIRVRNDLLEKLSRLKAKNEPWSAAIERALPKSTPQWTLPSFLFPTKTEASKVSMELAVREGLEFEDREIPVKIREDQ